MQRKYPQQRLQPSIEIRLWVCSQEASQEACCHLPYCYYYNMLLLLLLLLAAAPAVILVNAFQAPACQHHLGDSGGSGILLFPLFCGWHATLFISHSFLPAFRFPACLGARYIFSSLISSISSNESGFSFITYSNQASNRTLDSNIKTFLFRVPELGKTN